MKNNEPFPVFVRSRGYDHETRKFIVPSPHTSSGGPVDPQRISQRRHHRHPVEQCWQMMKNVLMVNFVPLSVEHLEEKAFEAASILNNDPMLLASFFHHAKLAL